MIVYVHCTYLGLYVASRNTLFWMLKIRFFDIFVMLIDTARNGGCDNMHLKLIYTSVKLRIYGIFSGI